MKAITQSAKHWLFLAAIFTILGTIGCKKSSPDETAADAEFGCTATLALQTLTNVPCQLFYSSAGPYAGQWLLATDYGTTRAYSCTFCDPSAYSAIVAGKSQSSPINVTVSGSIKRRYQYQEPINTNSGGYETYVLTVTNIQ